MKDSIESRIEVLLKEKGEFLTDIFGNEELGRIFKVKDFTKLITGR
jgi:hypothetical protein